ncbi:MAG TPA: hypothetical protein VNH65_02195 [Candidatus Acidoferrum sp.]|nr:hypothetical protein [Candidatus Acidoferrum sp.]
MTENIGSPIQSKRPRQGTRGFLRWFLVSALLITILLVYHYLPSADPRCIALLAHPDSDVVIPLPDRCMLTTDTPSDQVVKYLENEQKQRGLVFKAWISCQPSSQTQTTEFDFTHDPRWLPSYVPGAYQFRQTVILFRHAPPAAQDSVIAGEVCLMPKRRYATQVAGQCDGKFSIWK